MPDGSNMTVDSPLINPTPMQTQSNVPTQTASAPAQPSAGDQATGVGLINATPGSSTTTPGTSPTPPGGTIPVGPGTPVTGYNPAQASLTPYAVPPGGTVAGQINDIISQNSPLMQQAMAQAKDAANARGLLNSTQAITAGQVGLINTALPIAQADAAAINTAANNTSTAANQTAQFNAGQTNTALGQTAQASNSLQQTAMNNQTAYNIQQLQNEGNLKNIMAQGSINKEITQMQDENKLLLQSSAGAAQYYSQALSYMSQIITNTNLNEDQKSVALHNMVAQANDVLHAMSSISGTPDVSSILDFQFGGTWGYT